MQNRVNSSRSLILLTGATGYVGGRLLRALEAAGHRVRCLARRPEFLRDRVGPGTEVVQGDVLDAESLHTALSGVTTAYYLVHSMGACGEFEEKDRRAARNFGNAARAAGVGRIIYLADWAIPATNSLHTCAAGTKSARSCDRAACVLWSFVRRSSSGRAACLSS
jgi:uncharacterized protein YbjT (DUF2867 family)